MSTERSELPDPTAALADFDDLGYEEICIPDCKHLHNPDARNLVVCIDGTANQFGLQVTLQGIFFCL